MTELKDIVNSYAKLTATDIKLLTFTTHPIDSITHNLLLLTLDNFTILPEVHYRDLLTREESFEGGLGVLNFHTISIRESYRKFKPEGSSGASLRRRSG